MELVHGRGKVGSVLVEGIEGEFLVKLRCNRSKRQHGALNDAVSEFGGLGACMLRFAAKIWVEGKTIIVRAKQARSKRRRRTGRRRHGLVVPGPVRASRRPDVVVAGGSRRSWWSWWRNFRASRWWIVNVGITARRVYDQLPVEIIERQLNDISLIT